LALCSNFEFIGFLDSFPTAEREVIVLWLRNHLWRCEVLCIYVELLILVAAIFGVVSRFSDKTDSAVNATGMQFGWAMVPAVIAFEALVFYVLGWLGRGLASWMAEEGLWWKLIISVVLGIVPLLLFALILDINDKFVVSHIYTGSGQIPYAFLGPKKQGRHKSDSPLRQNTSASRELECPKCHARMLDEEIGALNCFSCGSPIREVQGGLPQVKSR
jgi:hypothetical protein